jgi:cell division protein FtsB
VAAEERTSLLWPAVLAAVLVLCAVIFYRGMANFQSVQEELAQVRQTNQRLDQENRALYRQVLSLRGDDAAVERAARREMGLVRQDEVVYRLPAADGES